MAGSRPSPQKSQLEGQGTGPLMPATGRSERTPFRALDPRYLHPGDSTRESMIGDLPDPRTSTYGRTSRGAVAGMARKHCAACYLPMPNRTRSPYCPICHDQVIRARDANRKRAQRDQGRLRKLIARLKEQGVQ